MGGGGEESLRSGIPKTAGSGRDWVTFGSIALIICFNKHVTKSQVGTTTQRGGNRE